MKAFALLASVVISNSVFASNLYVVEKMAYDVTGSYQAGDVIFCRQMEDRHNSISGCFNLNIFTKYSLLLNDNNKLELKELSSNESLVVGSLSNDRQKFLIDDLDTGIARKLEVDFTSHFDINLLTKKGVKLNTELGCHAPFECDWNIFTTETKLSVELELDGKSLEKVKLN